MSHATKPPHTVTGMQLLVNETMGNVGLAVNSSATLLAALNLSRSYVAVYSLPDGRLKCTFGSKGSR